MQALNYIGENLGNKELSLQMVAEKIGVSKNYFSKIFKESTGKLIQFTLDEPEYMIEDSKAVSKRIRDIKNILEMRYGMEFVSQIYFSQSCLEGKEIFDKVKNDFIE